MRMPRPTGRDGVAVSNLYWRRVAPGRYISGGLGTADYELGKAISGEWWYEGPGLDGIADTKAEAQKICQDHENSRETA